MLTHEDLQHLSGACKRYELKVTEYASFHGVMQIHLTGRIKATAYRERVGWSVVVATKTYRAETPTEAMAAAIAHIAALAGEPTP